jgi:hypothetical protein
LGYLARYVNFLIPLAVLGLLFFAITLIKNIRALKWRSLILIFLAVLFSMWIAGLAWASSNLSPLFLEKISLGLIERPDTLFVTTISNIIKTYDIPSAGLDGLSYLPYHWGSMWIFAQLSRLLDISVLDFYNLAYPVIIIPFFFKSLINFVFSYRKLKNLKESVNYKFWLVLIIGFAGFLPAVILWRCASGLNLIITSESYLLSIALVFALLSVVFVLFQRFDFNIKSRLKNIHVGLLFVLVLVLLGVIGLVKISTLFMLLALFIYLFFRLKLYKKKKFILFMLLVLVEYIAISRLTAYSSAFKIVPFYFVKSYVNDSFLPIFPAVYYFWLFLFVILKFYILKISNFKILKKYLKDNSLIEVEVLVFIALVGFVSANLWGFGGGTGAYFSEFQQWLAISLTLAYLPSVVLRRNLSEKNKKFKKILLFIIFLPAVVFMLFNVKDFFYNFLSDNIIVRNLATGKEKKWLGYIPYIQDKAASEKISLSSAFSGTASLPQQNLNSKPEYNLLKVLKKINDEKENQKKRQAVFVPQSNYLYWNAFPYLGVHFLVPSFSGEALLGGIQPFVPLEINDTDFESLMQQIPKEEDRQFVNSSYEVDDSHNKRKLDLTLSEQEMFRLYNVLQPINRAKLRGGFSYDIYEMPSEETYLDRTRNDEQLCALAKPKGFDNIIILTTNKDKVPETRSVVCK